MPRRFRNDGSPLEFEVFHPYRRADPGRLNTHLRAEIGVTGKEFAGISEKKAKERVVCREKDTAFRVFLPLSRRVHGSPGLCQRRFTRRRSASRAMAPSSRNVAP